MNYYPKRKRNLNILIIGNDFELYISLFVLFAEHHKIQLSLKGMKHNQIGIVSPEYSEQFDIILVLDYYHFPLSGPCGQGYYTWQGLSHINSKKLRRCGSADFTANDYKQIPFSIVDKSVIDWMGIS